MMRARRGGGRPTYPEHNLLGRCECVLVEEEVSKVCREHVLEHRARLVQCEDGFAIPRVGEKAPAHARLRSDVAVE
jgi:hypothetical protein